MSTVATARRLLFTISTTPNINCEYHHRGPSSSAHIPNTRLQLPALHLHNRYGCRIQPQTASCASGRGVLNISDLPTELLIMTLSRANLVSHKWRFPSLSVISSDALRTRFLESYASALKGSLPYYLDISFDISQFLEFNMAGASKSTLLWTLARTRNAWSLSLVIAFAGDLQQSYGFLSLNLCALSGD
ncbi:hypothetical protein OH76DRAFT_1486598 [Lentinus brumalis]|uniref:Uncharacterized protein n=1 Tax=Lentinus brumalis TaxID=2498619 RepID=A0A371CY19_9APHY|nr:hypothetical protein OH76DRAFT_1486598 [Polyporus brumalis]